MENKKLVISQELFTIAELAIKVRELELIVNNCLNLLNLEDRLLILRSQCDPYRYDFYIDEHYIGCVFTTEEIEIDSELNSESENPVQNKAITVKIYELELEIGEFEDDIVNRLAVFLGDIQLEFNSTIAKINASLSKYLTTELFRIELSNALKSYLTRGDLANYATKDYVLELLNKLLKFTLDTVVKHGSRNPVENEAIALAIDDSLNEAKKYTDYALSKFTPDDYEIKDLYDTTNSLLIKMNEEGEVLFKGIKVGDLPILSLFGSGVINIPVGGGNTTRSDSSVLLLIHPNVSTIYFDPNSHTTNEAISSSHDIELLYGNDGTLPIKNVKVSITGKKDDYHSSIYGVIFAKNLDGDYTSFIFKVSANTSYNLVYDNIFICAESVDPNGETVTAYATLQITKNLGGNSGKDACIILSDPAIINIVADYDLLTKLFLCVTNQYHFQLRMVKGNEEITNWVSYLEFEEESFTETNPGGVNNIYYNNTKNIVLRKTGNAVVLYLGYKFENNFIISNKTKLSQVPSYIRIKGVAGNAVGYGNISLNVNGMGLPGAAGARGPLAVFYGMWQGNNPSTDTIYRYTNDEVPIVCISENGEDRYFVLKDNEKSREGLSNKKNTDLFRKSPAIYSDMWTESTNYDFVWTKIILANQGRLGRAVFWGDFMFSELGFNSLNEKISYSSVSDKYNIFTEGVNGTEIGTSDWEPYFYINLRTGQLVCNDATIRGQIEATSGRIGNLEIKDGGLVFNNFHLGTFADYNEAGSVLNGFMSNNLISTFYGKNKTRTSMYVDSLNTNAIILNSKDLQLDELELTFKLETTVLFDLPSNVTKATVYNFIPGIVRYYTNVSEVSRPYEYEPIYIVNLSIKVTGPSGTTPINESGIGEGLYESYTFNASSGHYSLNVTTEFKTTLYLSRNYFIVLTNPGYRLSGSSIPNTSRNIISKFVSYSTVDLLEGLWFSEKGIYSNINNGASVLLLDEDNIILRCGNNKLQIGTGRSNDFILSLGDSKINMSDNGIFFKYGSYGFGIDADGIYVKIGGQSRHLWFDVSGANASNENALVKAANNKGPYPI